MIAISTSELRRNLSKYLTLATKERVLIQRGRNETFELIPSERISDADRWAAIPENAAAIQRGLDDIEQGRVKEYSINQIKELLGL